MNADEIRNMPAGREMDALVAERVMGLVECDKWRIFNSYPEPSYIKDVGGCEHTHCRPAGFACHYSTNIAAAWEVVEKMAQLPAAVDVVAEYHSTGNGYSCWICKYPRFDEPSVAASADTPALAVCRAALLAAVGGLT